MLLQVGLGKFFVSGLKVLAVGLLELLDQTVKLILQKKMDVNLL